MPPVSQRRERMPHWCHGRSRPRGHSHLRWPSQRAAASGHARPRHDGDCNGRRHRHVRHGVVDLRRQSPDLDADRWCLSPALAACSTTRVAPPTSSSTTTPASISPPRPEASVSAGGADAGAKCPRLRDIRYPRVAAAHGRAQIVMDAQAGAPTALRCAVIRRAAGTAASSAAALLRHSRSSSSGTESATMPAPA